MKLKILFINLLLLVSFTYGHINGKIDSLKSIMSGQGIETEQDKNTLFDIANFYSDSLNNKDSALVYFKIVQRLSKVSKDYKLQIKALDKIAICEEYLGNHDSSLFYFNKSLKTNEQIGDSLEMSDAYFNMAVVYEIKGDFKNAIKMYVQSSKISDNFNDNSRKLSTMVNIGELYRVLNKTEKALSYLNLALSLCKDTANHLIYSKVYNEFAVIYKNQDKLDSSIYYYKKSISHAKMSDSKILLSASYGNLGTVYKLKKEYQNAINYYEKSINIDKKIQNNYSLSINMIDLANIYYEIGGIEKSEAYLIQAQNYAKRGSSHTINYSIYEMYSKIKEIQGDYKLALQYYKAFEQNKDSIYNVKSIEKIADIETKYQTEKQQKEIEILNVKNQLQIKKTERNHLIIRFSISLLVIFLVLFSLALYLYFQKNKAYKILVKHNIDEVKKASILKDVTSNKKYETSSLDDTKKNDLLKKLLNLMDEEKPYLDSQLKIDILSQKLDTNRQYLSQLINGKLNCNFADFINEYRIKEAKNLLSNSKNDKYTIDGIAKMIGFNHRSSFNTAFKKFVFVTPTFFRNNR